MKKTSQSQTATCRLNATQVLIDNQNNGRMKYLKKRNGERNKAKRDTARVANSIWSIAEIRDRALSFL